MADDNIPTLGYSEEINESWLDTVLADLSIEGKAILARKIRQRTKATIDLMRNANAALENEINQLEQQNILASIESIETVTANNNAKKLESEKLRSQIVIKKAELFEKDKKNIIEMADFMINKRPVLLKLINEKINEIKKFENEEKMTVLVNTAFATTSTLPMIEAKKMSTENTWDSSRHKAYDTLAVAEEKVVTSKFFDENQAANIIDKSAKENIETGNPEKEINEVPTETINQDNFTAENLLEGQGYKQQDDVPSCAPSCPYIQSMPDSPNVSTSTTGYEDTEFPQCIGFRKTPFSFFGESSSLNSPGADGQNDNNNKFNT